MMKRIEFEQILDNTRKLLEKITKIEEILNLEVDSLCTPLCNIIDTLAEYTKTTWDDNLWGKVYDYSIPTSELTSRIENYSINDRESKGEREVKIFDD